MPRLRHVPVATVLATLALLWVSASRLAGAERPPNFVFILADDLGFSDTGCYGGEIATPNLDGLAAGGLRFTQFYNTARCWPTRSALLSGYYPQQIRMDPPRGRLPDWARLLPHHLRPAGYRSYHSGKWHVNGAPKVIADGGFDRSYRIVDEDRNFNPRAHSLDDQPLPPVPPGPGDYYTSTEYSRRLVEFLRDHARDHADRPFFAYLAFTVPHFPLHAPPEDIARYRDRYLAGWDALREERARRVRELGIATGPAAPPEPEVIPHWNLGGDRLRAEISPDEVDRAVPWSELTDAQRRFQATKMAIHAAMVDRMDREIGRVLEQVRAMGAWENTVIVFASDNGASAEFLNRGDRHDPAAPAGSPGSYLCLGPGWSTAANTPFRLHKSWVHEGGIATPLIVHWPDGIRDRGALRHDVGHVIDILPTFLDLAGIAPDRSGPAADAPPLPGRSLVASFRSDRGSRDGPLYFHHERNRGLRLGDWKAVTRRPETNTWALYNLRTDRAEQRDLALEEPERLRGMAEQWETLTRTFARQAGLPDPLAPGP